MEAYASVYSPQEVEEVEVESEAYEPMTKERQMKVDRAKKKAYDADHRARQKGDSAEAMSSYDRNRKRAAQRAAARNAARAAGKTGVVPGVGYVSPRKERETYTDEKGTVRHKSGAKMP